MRNLRHVLLSILSKSRQPSCQYRLPAYATSSTTEAAAIAIATGTPTLSPEEITKISLLIPRLCNSNHIQHAIRLTEAALTSTSPSMNLNSLSVSILIDRLAAQPDMVESMALLNRLKHNPRTHFSILTINHMLVNAYFKKQKPREALKVFQWMRRSDSPSSPNSAMFSAMVLGFCRNHMVLEGLRVLRETFVRGRDCEPGMEVRVRVYRALLREARIKEAVELNKALGCVGGGDGSHGVENVLKLLDQIISDWKE